jgi:hypothetical protein
MTIMNLVKPKAGAMHGLLFNEPASESSPSKRAPWDNILHVEGRPTARNTKLGSITVPLTSCLTGLDKSVLQKKLSVVIQLIPNQSNRRSTVQ